MADEIADNPAKGPDGDSSPGAQHQVAFHMIKSNAYRVVHADGVYGNVTPALYIHMSFFNERSPLPTKIVHNISESGELGDEDIAKRESRDGIVREVEVGVLMDVRVAMMLRDWLGQQIDIVRAQIDQVMKEDEQDVE